MGEPGGMNERGAAGTDGTAGGRCGAAAAARQLESPGRARVGAGAARCHLAAAVAAGGAGETIKVSRRSALCVHTSGKLLRWSRMAGSVLF